MRFVQLQIPIRLHGISIPYDGVALLCKLGFFRHLVLGIAQAGLNVEIYLCNVLLMIFHCCTKEDLHIQNSAMETKWGLKIILQMKKSPKQFCQQRKMEIRGNFSF